MNVPSYRYPVEQCDVQSQDQARLEAYRAFRSQCLESLRGADNSVAAQIHDLVWHTMVFRSLNEARRLEHPNQANGAMWELISTGYASLMTLGIRKLIDTDKNANSIASIIARIERRPELLTRENFVCYDAIPFDGQTAHDRYIATIKPGGEPSLQWLATIGPEAWGMSELMNKAFDEMAGHPAKRRRSDKIDPSVLVKLKDALASPSIQKVRTMADKVVAHAERLSATGAVIPLVTYNDIDAALRTLVRVTNFLSARFFYDAAFGTVVPTPQFDVFESIDHPWIATDAVPALQSYWDQLAHDMDSWAVDAETDFVPTGNVLT